MATLPLEQVTQRNTRAQVAVTYDRRIDSPGITLWLSTTTLPYTVVNTATVAAGEDTWAEIDATIVAAGEAAYTDYNLFTEEGLGVDTTP